MLESKFAEIGGMRIFYIESKPEKLKAETQNILFIHGFFSRGKSFTKLMEGLSGDYIMYAPDLPGNGASDNFPDRELSFKKYAGFLISFCSYFGIKKTIIAGDSMGGGLSIVLAGLYPDLISKVILIDSITYQTKQPLSTKILLSPLFGPFIFKRLFNWDQFKTFFTRGVYQDDSKINMDELKENYVLFDTPSRREFSYRLAKMATDVGEVEAMIPLVNAPTLIIWGENDRLVPVENGRRLEEEMKNSRLEIIPGTGHASFDEKPETALVLIKGFLK